VLYEPEKYPPKNQVPPDVILTVLDETIMRTQSSRGEIDSY
jgi:hypothetical protein